MKATKLAKTHDFFLPIWSGIAKNIAPIPKPMKYKEATDKYSRGSLQKRDSLTYQLSK